MIDVRPAAASPTGRRTAPHSALTAVLWPLALMAAAHLALQAYSGERYDVDFRALHDGATRFWDGASVYADPWFLLTPSGLLAMLPFGLVGHDVAFAVWTTVSIAAAATGIACALRFVGAPLTGAVAAATTLGVCVSEALTSTLLLGNLNNSLLLALGAGFLLADLRGRWVLAGVLLGVSLALKPVLVLLLLVPLLRRRWQTLGWAISIPVVLNVVGLALVPARSDFFSVTVPNLLTSRVGWNNSLWATGTYFGVPAWAIAAARLLVLVLAVVAVWRLRVVEDAVLRSSASYGLLVLAMFLSGSLSQAYYSLFLVPLLVTVVRAGSAMRSPAAWFAVCLFTGPNHWTFPGSPGLTDTVDVARWPVGWSILFGVLVVWAWRQARPGVPDVPAPPEEPQDTVVLPPLPRHGRPIRTRIAGPRSTVRSGV
ncbi:glycosyltransferase 87 family protein [Trujillonella endophytica]|uniref:glycosyltransferase 87 family protein n=1 Tax=Trujillonella endophytica TaxID=673521 RepID=UPI000B863D38|nr:glycosyltransferase 87 family protein [Trujillella endophytica]